MTNFEECILEEDYEETEKSHEKLSYQKIGTKRFGTVGLVVDITDPCYDKDICCRMKASVVEGEYECSILIADEGVYGKHVKTISIQLIGNNDKTTEEEIGTIGVDSGLAGFFTDKPDYDDDAWSKFCAALNDDGKSHDAPAWIIPEGFFSESGYGDGCYSVYAYKRANNDIIGLEIRFF